MSSAAGEEDYPGRRLGLPETGPGAVAGWGKRVVALIIDWVLSMLVASVLLGQAFREVGNAYAQLAPLAVFALEATVLTTLLGGSAGQLIVGVTVRRMSGEQLDPFRALLRSVLICLVIPPVIYNPDQRGLHDLAVDSIALRK